MDLGKAIIIPKASKLQRDMERFNLSEEEVIDFYRRENINVGKILESHKRQSENLDKLKSFFRQDQFISRSKLTRKLAKKADLIISFGGDNHFLYLSHFLDSTPILGINSDSKSSRGALMNLNLKNFSKFFDEIRNGGGKIEKWPRLEVEIDGKKLDTLAVSEIFFGEESRFAMSRHLLTLRGQTEYQKGSGLLISTGVGSTGWYRSSSRYLFPKNGAFPKTLAEARFLLTEPHMDHLTSPRFAFGSIRPGEELKLQSLNDSHGVLSIDSDEVYDVKEGSMVKVRIGKPLNVISSRD